MILELVREAVASGASQARACELAGLDVRTVQRWRRRPDGEEFYEVNFTYNKGHEAAQS